MDRRQRYLDPEEQLRTAMDGLKSGLWTALPGTIQSFDPVAMTAAVQPGVKAMMVTAGGLSPADMPILPHCLVVFPRGGGCSLTFPLEMGDECMVVFSSRALDGFWQSGKAQPSTDLRSHDLSDGVAFVGLTSQARPLAGVSTTSTQLRSDDGATVIDLNPAAQTIALTAPGGITMTGPVQVNGAVIATGNVTAGGIDLEHHVHTGVQSGQATTGPPEG